MIEIAGEVPSTKNGKAWLRTAQCRTGTVHNVRTFLPQSILRQGRVSISKTETHKTIRRTLLQYTLRDSQRKQGREK